MVRVLLAAWADLQRVGRSPSGAVSIPARRRPCFSQDGLKPFSWALFPNTTHAGQPETFDFDWELQDPAWD